MYPNPSNEARSASIYNWNDLMDEGENFQDWMRHRDANGTAASTQQLHGSFVNTQQENVVIHAQHGPAVQHDASQVPPAQRMPSSVVQQSATGHASQQQGPSIRVAPPHGGSQHYRHNPPSVPASISTSPKTSYINPTSPQKSPASSNPLTSFALASFKTSQILLHLLALQQETQFYQSALYQLSAGQAAGSVKYSPPNTLGLPNPHSQPPTPTINFTYTTHEMKRVEENFKLYHAYSQSVRTFEKYKWWSGVFERHLKWNSLLWNILDKFGADADEVEEDDEDSDKNNPFSEHPLDDDEFINALSLQSASEDKSDELLESMEEVLSIIKKPPAHLDDFSSSLLKELFVWLGTRLNKAMAKDTVVAEENLLLNDEDNLLNDVDNSSKSRPRTFTNRLRLLESLLILLIEHDALSFASQLYQPTTSDLIHGNLLNKFLIERCSIFRGEYQLLLVLQQLPLHQLDGTSLDTIKSHITRPIHQFFATQSFDEYPRVMLHLLLVLQSLSYQYPSCDFMSYLIFDVVVKNKWPLKYVSTLVLPQFAFKMMVEQERKHGTSPLKLHAFIKRVFQEYFNLYEAQFESMPEQQQSEHANEFVNGFLLPHVLIIEHCYTGSAQMKRANDGSQFPVLVLFKELGIVAHDLYSSINDTQKNIVPLHEHITTILFDLAFKMGTTTPEHIPLLGVLRTESTAQLEQLSAHYPQSIGIVLKCIRFNLDFFYRTQPHVLTDLHSLLEKKLAPGFKHLHINHQLLRECFLLINSNDTNATLKREKNDFGRNIITAIDWRIQSAEFRKRTIKIFFLSAANTSESVGHLTGGIDTFLLNSVLAQPAGMHLSRLSPEDAAKDLDDLFAAFGFSSPHHVTKNPILEGLICHILLSYLESNAGAGSEVTNDLLEFEHSKPRDRKILWSNVSALVQARLNMLQEQFLHTLSSFLLHRYVDVFALYHDDQSSDSAATEKDIRELSTMIAPQIKRNSHLRKFILELHTKGVKDDNLLADSHLSSGIWFQILTSSAVLSLDEGLTLLESICRERLIQHLPLSPIIEAFKRRRSSVALSPTQIVDTAVNRSLVWCALCMIQAFPRNTPSLEAGASNTISTMDQCGLWIAAECATNLSRDLNNTSLSERRQKSLPFWFQFVEYYFLTAQQYAEQGGSAVFPSYLRTRYDKIFDECAAYFSNTRLDIATFSELKSWDPEKILASRAKVLEMMAVTNFGIVTDGNPPTQRPAQQRVIPPPPPAHIQQQHQMTMSHLQQPPPQQQSLANSQHPVSHSMNMSTLQSSQFVPPHVQQQPPQNIPVQKPSVEMPRVEFLSNSASPYVGAYTKADSVRSHIDAANLLPRPLTLPTNPFQDDIFKFRYMKRCVENALRDNALSSDILLLPSMFHHHAGNIESENSISQDVLGLFDEFCFCTREQERLDEELEDIYNNLYDTESVPQNINLVTPYRNLVPATIPVSKIKFKDPQVNEKIQENRNASKSISERINDIVSSLSLFCTAFEMIATNKDARHGAVKIYLKLLPKLLDHQVAWNLNQIWKHFVLSISMIGENIVSQEKHLQKQLMRILMETPRNHAAVLQMESSANQAPLPHPQRPSAPHPIIYKPAKSEQDFFQLYKAFNPAVLLSNNGSNIDTIADYIDVLELLYHAHESISVEEFRAFKERLSLESLFSLFAEKPSGQRFSESAEMSRLIELMKNSLCNPKTRVTLGNDILRHAVEIAFPLEISPFLELLLHISCSGEFDDMWPSKLFYAELLPQVDAQTALEWISIVNRYSVSLSASGVVAAASLVERLITKTQLQNILQRENIHADRWNESLLFFSRCFLDDKEELKRPLSVEQFTTVLHSIRSIADSIPIFIDRFFGLFATVLHPYVLTQHFHHRQVLSDTVQTLQQWKHATFHEQSPKPFEQMWDILPHDPQSISTIFSQLSFSFVTRSMSNSRLLCSLVRLYLDINLVKPQSIPEVLHDAIETYDPYARQPIWSFLSSRDLSYLFNGYTLSRLFRLCALRTDATKSLITNMYTLQRAALHLDDANFATVAMREIANCVTLVVHERHSISRSYYLAPKRVIEIIQKVLFPLAMKYPSAHIIQIYFGLVSSLEEKVEPVLADQTIHFANHVGSCPYEVNTAKRGSGDDETHAEMMNKIHGIVEQLAKNAPESFCRVCLAIVPHLQIRRHSKLQMLESLLCSFLEQTTHEHPRALAASIINFDPDIPVQSPQYQKILVECCECQCTILLTVLLHKSVTETVNSLNYQNSQYIDRSAIKNTYLQNMMYVMTIVPHEAKDYEIIYLYLFALEMMESDFWDFNDPAVKKRTNQFMEMVQHLGSKHTFSFSVKDAFKKSTLDEDFTEAEVSPQTSLACKAMEIYVDRLQLIQGDGRSTSGSLLSSSRYSEVRLPKLKSLVKLRKKAAFKAYHEFFDVVQEISGSGVGMETFRRILRSLFPYPEYLLKV